MDNLPRIPENILNWCGAILPNSPLLVNTQILREFFSTHPELITDYPRPQTRAVAAWNQYIRTLGAWEVGFATGVDLSGLDLTGIELSEICFDQADFSGSDLSWSEIDNTMFSNCRLNKTIFDHTFLDRVILMKSQARAASWVDALLEQVHIHKSVLSETSFSDSEFNNLRIIDSQLDNAQFLDCRVSGLQSRGNKWANTLFCDGEIKSAIFTDEVWDNTILERVLLSDLEFPEPVTTKTGELIQPGLILRQVFLDGKIRNLPGRTSHKVVPMINVTEELEF